MSEKRKKYKHYSMKEEWEKKIDSFDRKTRRRMKRQRENEIIFDPLEIDKFKYN